MVIFYLLMTLFLLFVIWKIGVFVLKKFEDIDDEFDIKERVENIQKIDKRAGAVKDFEKENKDKIENEEKNKEAVDEFLKKIIVKIN